MKKLLTLTLALALMLCLSVPVFAADETSGKTDLTMTYAASAPTYTVTIPATLTIPLNNIGADMDITVSDSADLGGKNVVITYDEAEWLYNNNATGSQYKTITFKVLVGAAEKRLDDTIFTFSADGTKTIKVVIGDADVISNPATYVMPNSPYTGSITFGIGLL